MTDLAHAPDRALPDDVDARVQTLFPHDPPERAIRPRVELSDDERRRFTHFDRELQSALRTDVEIQVIASINPERYATWMQATVEQETALQFFLGTTDAFFLVVGKAARVSSERIDLDASHLGYGGALPAHTCAPGMHLVVPTRVLQSATFTRKRRGQPRDTSWEIRTMCSITPDGVLRTHLDECSDGPSPNHRTSMQDAAYVGLPCTTLLGRPSTIRAEGIDALRAGLTNRVTYHIVSYIKIDEAEHLICGYATGVVAEDHRILIRVIPCKIERVLPVIPPYVTSGYRRRDTDSADALFLDVAAVQELYASEIRKGDPESIEFADTISIVERQAR